MEKQKNGKVEMKVVKNNEEPKLSYEELNGIAQNLYAENKKLGQEVMQLKNFINTINRLDYLFKVLHVYYGNKGNLDTFSKEFVEKCIEEIQDTLTLPEEEETKGEK